MKDSKRLCRRLATLCALAGFVIGPLSAETKPLDAAIQAGGKNLQQEVQSQQRIDQLDDNTRAMLEDYLQQSRELESAMSYNQQLQRLLDSQQRETISLQKQINDIDITQREITPLMLRMLSWLEELVEIDQPFLPQERRLRVAQLRELMDNAASGTGEKYRRILEAYHIEMEYARNIEAYRGELLDARGRRSVDFLRLGRVGLYYQTLDRGESGYWDVNHGRWQVLPASYNQRIRNGLRMAQKQTAPDLLRLPVPAPQFVKQGLSNGRKIGAQEARP